MNAAIGRHCSFVIKRFSARTNVTRHSIQQRQVARASMSSSTTINERADAILDYWLGASWRTVGEWDFDHSRLQLWFGKNDDVDSEIRTLFGEDIERLSNGSYDGWNRVVNEGAGYEEGLAFCILGDQFCRNVFRNTKDMYKADDKVLPLAKRLLQDVHSIPISQRFFLLLPLMHSENIEDQEACVAAFKELLEKAKAGQHDGALEFLNYSVQYAIDHRDIVAKYGRFPHRNALLGRENTPEEVEGFNQGSIKSF